MREQRHGVFLYHRRLQVHLRKDLELVGAVKLGLPSHLVLAVDLGADTPVRASVGEQSGTDDNLLRTSDLLVVIHVRRASRAEVAVNAVACVGLVSDMRFSSLKAKDVPESPL